jgi:hypothetical protein
MQTFDQEIERLIGAGVIDREIGLSYATNRTNLQLKLDTQGDDAAKAESIRLKDDDGRRTGSYRAVDAAHRPGRGEPRAPVAAHAGGVSEIDDLIER